MSQAKTMTYTEDLRSRCGDALSDALDTAAAASAAGDWRQATGAAGQLAEWAGHTGTAVVRDALAADTDWWTLAEVLELHPQAAYEQYQGLNAGLPSPAAQRPGLAVVCTAGLVATHDFDDEHGTDLDDLGDDHSLASEPTVARLRAAAAALGEDLWIAVRLPGDYDGADDAPEADTAITRWTTVVLHPDELGWLREALALNAAGDEQTDDEDDLEPL
jgi:hypothetical protein